MATGPQTGYMRDTVSNAEGLFSLPLLPPGTYDVTAELSGFATSIGGPITQNRLFFFVAGEMQRQKNTRNVVFSLTGITPNADNAEAYNYFKGLEEPFEATNDAEAILGRVDDQMPEGNRLAVRYSFSNNKALNSNATGNALSDTTISALSDNGTERDRTNTVVGEFTSALRTSTLLEIRGQYSREQRPRDANTLQPLAVPLTNPNQTLYQQLLLIGINLNQTPLNSLPQLTTDQLSALAVALGITPNPYLGVNVMGVDTEFKNPRATQVGGGTACSAIAISTSAFRLRGQRTRRSARSSRRGRSQPCPRCRFANRAPSRNTPR